MRFLIIEIVGVCIRVFFRFLVDKSKVSQIEVPIILVIV